LRDRTWGAPNASYYLQGRGYTEEDVMQAVSDAAGVDMRAWFDRYVGGTEDMDYDEVLAAAGMKLARDSSNAGAWRIEPLPGATAAQTTIREGWVSGKTSS
jgi:predicted metalloprotease with PDZ domain